MQTQDPKKKKYTSTFQVLQRCLASEKPSVYIFVISCNIIALWTQSEAFLSLACWSSPRRLHHCALSFRLRPGESRVFQLLGQTPLTASSYKLLHYSFLLRIFFCARDLVFSLFSWSFLFSLEPYLIFLKRIFLKFFFCKFPPPYKANKAI